MNIYVLLFWFFILKIKTSIGVKINILSKDSAFIKYTNESDRYEVIYKQPLEDKLTISVSFADLKATKQLERSKYKSTVYTDKQVLSTQSNLNKDSFTINAICKFDHDQLAAFALDKVCCEITLRSATADTATVSSSAPIVFDRKLCKLEISLTSSACYAQLEVAKDHFNFRKAEEFELAVESRVFSSSDGKCADRSSVIDNLAMGFPSKLAVSQGLQIEWRPSDVTESFGILEIGVAVDSIERNSKTIFPLRIRSTQSFASAVLVCSFGEELSLSAISFESTKFEGEFKKPSDKLVKILLALKENTADNGAGTDSSSEQLVNLRVRLVSGRTYGPNQDRKMENWISCRVEQAVVQKTRKTIQRKSTDQAKRVFLKVNEDNFIIIPIVQKAFLFSILSQIYGPIELGTKQWKVFNVHNTRDGSLIDITSKTQCKPISNATLKCPFDENDNTKKELIKSPNWNVILTMMSWQKMVNIPFDFWQAEDWKIVTMDKILNKVANWNYPQRPSGSCKSVYQSSRCHLFARLVKDTGNTEKVYFGQSSTDQYPLLDMTSQLSPSNILLSNNNIRVSINDNMVLLTANSFGSSDFSMVNNQNSKIAFELITVEEETVSIIDVEVTCIHTVTINQPSTPDNLTFRRMVVQSERSKKPKESCYFKIKLVFSDGTRGNLIDYQYTNYQLDLVHTGSSVVIRNLENFLYEPKKYQNAGKFVLHLYESDECEKNKLIFKKPIDLYESQHKKVPKTSTPAAIIKYFTTTKKTLITTRPTTTGNRSDKVTHIVGGIDTSTLFLSMKILIGLVILVVLIVILNCIIKFRNRKSASLLDRQLNTCQIYGQMDKLTASTYSPADINSQNSNNPHPPLLPPPGPLYNSSDSSQLDLAVNATPDIFWGLPHPGDNIDRTMANNHIVMGMKMNTLNGQCNTAGFPNIFSPNRKTSPSQQSDNIEYNYLSSNGTRSSHPRTKKSSQNGYHYPPGSIHDSDSLASGSGSKTSSQIAVIVPPCPPLRWNNNWSSNQFPVYFPNDKELSKDPSVSRLSTEHSSQSSLTPSHSSSWEIKQNLVLPPIGFNSIDNVCEKSSGLGSLTSTQPGSDCSKKEAALIDSPKPASYSTSH